MGLNWSDPAYYPLAVFFCILGAGIGVCMAWAIAWQLGNTTDDSPDRFTFSNEQARYMKEVRERNQQWMAARAGVRLYLDHWAIGHGEQGGPSG